MIRDFREDAYNKLIEIIDRVSPNGTWENFCDFLSDGAMLDTAMDLLLYSDVTDVDLYHEFLLDGLNTSKTKIDQIFANVNSVDSAAGSVLAGNVSGLQAQLDYIEKLSNIITISEPIGMSVSLYLLNQEIAETNKIYQEERAKELEKVQAFYDELPENVREQLTLDDFVTTDDGFVMCTKPIADILDGAGIVDTTMSELNKEDVYAYYDDWYFYGIVNGDGKTTYGLLKMREQENDKALPADNDDPGVTISFVKFDINKLDAVIDPSNADDTDVMDAFVSEINKVTYSSDSKHDDELQKYFSDVNSEASYLVAEQYVKFIASTAEDGKIVLPNLLTEDQTRVIAQLEALNEKAGRTIYDPDNNCLNIKNPNNLSEEEEYAILVAYTADVNYNSFAAEVKFHSDALTDWKGKIPVIGKTKWYLAALRADMGIGEEKESNVGGGFDEYYNLDSDMVNEQEEAHGER